MSRNAATAGGFSRAVRSLPPGRAKLSGGFYSPGILEERESFSQLGAFVSSKRGSLEFGNGLHQVDGELIARAQAGNASAIGALYDQLHPGVFRYLSYQVGDRQTAEDLTSEVFLRLVKALPRYRPGQAPFAAWVYRIARNLVVDHARRARVRNHAAWDEAAVVQDELAEAAAERRLTADLLVRALQTLTAEQREVVTLRLVVRMPIAQVCQVTGKSESAVKALQRRGLQALRKTLTSWEVGYE